MPRPLLQPYISSLAPHRIFLYSVLSSIAVLAVITNALKNHGNFYSVAVYLSRSSGTLVVLANFGFLVALSIGRFFQHVFFGPLRATEVERLYDRMWFFVTESLLAFTIFRDEFDVPFALMFGILLFTKCFHWLLSDRIEWMDQRPYPGPPLLFHVRINALTALLWMSDFAMFTLAVESILTNGVGGIVLFASEYAILLSSLLNSGAKYMISIVELRRAARRGGENAPPWEDKSMWIFYVELATDFLKLVTYLTFFILVLTFYGFPLNIVRDVYITARSFIMRFRDLIRYRTATRNMDQRYPNATEEEMNAMSDRTCIICREEMVFQSTTSNQTGSQPAGTQNQRPTQQLTPRDGPNMTPKKLPCGHVFHFYCLRSWLERQQSCPTCRRTVLDTRQRPPAPLQLPAPAPPQPGNLPQMPNLGAQQDQGQQRAGNLGGLFGRIMGVAGAPPIVPGQFAPGQLQPGGGLPGVIPNPGWFYPPHPGLRGAVPQPQVHVFQGFRAADGMWHPWALGAEANAQDQPAVPQVSTNTGDTMPQHAASSQSVPPTDPHHLSSSPGQRQPASSASTNLSRENIVDESGTSPNPREAAASAALRRSNSSTTATLNQSSSSHSNTSTPVIDGHRRPEITGSSSANSPTTNNASGSNSSIPLTRSPLHSATSNTGGPSRSGMPSLIPMYDPAVQPPAYRPVFSAQHGTPSFSPYGTPEAPGQGQYPFYRQAYAGMSASRPRPHVGGYNPALYPNVYSQSMRTAHFSPSAVQSPGRSSVQRSPTTLPPTLTDEQLARLDRLTRDTIDERLRILEGVQGTVSRCIDDLLRVRSALPQSTPTLGQPEHHRSQTISISENGQEPPSASHTVDGSSKSGASLPLNQSGSPAVATLGTSQSMPNPPNPSLTNGTTTPSE